MSALGIILGLGLPVKPLSEANQDWSRRGLGCSDNSCLAAALASKFDYTNTYYHRFPHFDITEVPAELKGAVEFLSCSDVLEHIPPPIQPALDGLAAVLAPGGFALLSVPVGDARHTREFYPGLRTYEVVGDVLAWTDDEGKRHTDISPEFHGGQGQTVAFRKWGELDLITSLEGVGFSVTHPPSRPELGVPDLANSGTFIARLSPQLL